MLERIREGSQGPIAYVIVGLVILTFALAGVGSYLGGQSDEPVATVNGEAIGQSVLERAYQTERSRMESQFGAAFSELASDAAYLRQFREGILDRLIGEMLVDQTADSIGMRVSDAQVRTAILEIPAFQIGGQFNNDRYLAMIRQNGFQPSGFRDYMRREMTRQQVAQALLGSEFSLMNEVTQSHALQQQTRDLRFISVDANNFSDVEVSEEEIQNRYQSNIGAYDTQEQISLSYLDLSVEELSEKASVTEEEVAAYYQDNLGQYKTDEERRASHILLEFGDDESAAETLAQEVLAKVNAGGDFAELAKEFSTDIVTAENGGDLDWFERGVMDPAFEEATYGLANVGDVSSVIKSAFGYHIIKLTDLKAEEISTLEQVRAEITEATKKQKATEEFYTLQQRMSELAFEMPDTLDEMAEELNKSVETTALFSRTSAPELVNTNKVLSPAFSSESISDAVNSELIELTPEHVIVFRVVEHKPVRTKALDEVSAEISSELVAQKSQQAAKVWADAVLGKLNSNEDVAGDLEGQGLKWNEQTAVNRYNSEVPVEVRNSAFKLALGEGANASVVELSDGNVALLQLTQINAAEAIDDTQLVSLQQRLSATEGQTVYGDFIESLKSTADIEKFSR